MGDWTGTVPTILAGDVPTGDDWKNVTDELDALSAAWTTYSSTWSASTTPPAIGNGTITSRYRRVGKTVNVLIRTLMGSTTTFGNGIYSWSLPTSTRGLYLAAGSAVIDDSGTAIYIANVVPVLSASTVIGYVAASSYITQTGPMTWANGDNITIAMTYEAA